MVLATSSLCMPRLQNPDALTVSDPMSLNGPGRTFTLIHNEGTAKHIFERKSNSMENIARLVVTFSYTDKFKEVIVYTQVCT